MPHQALQAGQRVEIDCSLEVEDQFRQLWDCLCLALGVRGLCKARVVRIVGCISHELYDNGGLNWDRGFTALAKRFGRIVSSQVGLVDDDVARLGHDHHDERRAGCSYPGDCSARSDQDVQRRNRSGSPVMRKPRIASELTAAELSSAEHSVEDSERGDASTEFVMVGALLVLLTMAILQVSFALYARTMLVDAAAAGARYGTMRDRTPQEGMERTRQLIEGVLPSSYAENISYRQSSDSTGVRTLEVTVKSPLPVLGPWGFPDSIEVKGHAIYAEHRSGD